MGHLGNPLGNLAQRGGRGRGQPDSLGDLRGGRMVQGYLAPRQPFARMDYDGRYGLLGRGQFAGDLAVGVGDGLVDIGLFQRTA